jgi:transcriptional regulator with XRE-family HTH domain
MRQDYSRIARDFLRALRGKRSQAAFSRRLGYRTNVAYTWESGRAFPTAATVLAAAARTGVDVRGAIARFYRAAPPWLTEVDPTSPAGVARLLDDLRGRTSIVELARVAKRSRFAIARWLKGDAEPRWPEFLLLVETTSLRLLDFLATLTDVSKLPSLAVAWAELEATRRAAYDVPWTQAVLRALELTEYKSLERHERGWLARRVGISL